MHESIPSANTTLCQDMIHTGADSRGHHRSISLPFFTGCNKQQPPGAVRVGVDLRRALGAAERFSALTAGRVVTVSATWRCLSSIPTRLRSQESQHWLQRREALLVPTSVFHKLHVAPQGRLTPSCPWSCMLSKAWIVLHVHRCSNQVNPATSLSIKKGPEKKRLQAVTLRRRWAVEHMNEVHREGSPILKDAAVESSSHSAPADS